MPGPRLSVITPVYNPSVEAFAETVESVFRQRFSDWEWILVNDGSPNPDIVSALSALVERDSRVTVLTRERNGGIVAASNDGIAVASGEFLAFLDDDDLLRVDAFDEVIAAINARDDIDYVYSDEDKIMLDGTIDEQFRKPDWSPERLRHQMYTSHFSVIRTSLVREVGGFRDGYDGSQDHDLVLRVTELSRRIWHIPKPLYHWRVGIGSAAGDPTAKPYAWTAGVRAVQDQVDRLGITAKVIRGKVPGRYTLLRKPDVTTPVSIIVPTRGTIGRVRGVNRAFILDMVRSIIGATHHEDYEIVVVYDTGTPAGILEQLIEIGGGRIVLVEFDEPFNFSRKCNVGYLHARGDVLVFMNDDMEAFSDGPIENLIAPLIEEGVGMTGARLLFEDTTHQHAGLCYGDGSIAHGLYRYAMDAPGHGDALWMNREVSALTGACIALTRQTFEDVGGFSEPLGLNFNDVDLSMKVRASGKRLLWMEAVTLFHFESVSRSTVVEAFEIETMKSRWGDFEKMREKYALPLWGPDA